MHIESVDPPQSLMLPVIKPPGKQGAIISEQSVHYAVHNKPRLNNLDTKHMSGFDHTYAQPSETKHQLHFDTNYDLWHTFIFDNHCHNYCLKFNHRFFDFGLRRVPPCITTTRLVSPLPMLNGK